MFGQKYFSFWSTDIPERGAAGLRTPASRLKATSRGWGDGGLEGDMGLSQDGPIGTSQQANPQDSPPVALRHPTRAPNPRNQARLAARVPRVTVLTGEPAALTREVVSLIS